MTQELYEQMERKKSPPTMNQFIDVYVDAVNRLEQKITEKDERIKECISNNDQIRAQMNIMESEFEPDAKKFVIRVIEVNGVYCSDPIFKMTTDSHEQATVRFADFADGDVIVNLSPSNTKIEVEIINNHTNELLHEFQIYIRDFDDKQRQEHEVTGPGIREPIVILYEGQLIYNRKDYHKGFLLVNQHKLEDLKQFKNQYQIMQEQLLDLFKNQALRKNFNQVLMNTSRQYSALNQSQQGHSLLHDRTEGVNIRGDVVRALDNSGLRIVTGKDLNASLNRSQHKDRRVMQSDVKTTGGNGTPDITWNPFVHILFYINIAMLIASFFVNWHRASFLSLIVAIVFLTWYLQRNEFDHLLPPLFLAVGYALALTFDLLWLIQNSREVWSHNTWMHGGSLSGMDKFVVIMSYILLGTEGAALAVSVLLHFAGITKSPADKGKKPNFQMKI